MESIAEKHPRIIIFPKELWMVWGILWCPGGSPKNYPITWKTRPLPKVNCYPDYIPKGEKERMPIIFANLRSITHHYDHRFTQGTIF
jgi:hypothetical protein